MAIQENDIVARKSYHQDVLFRVSKLSQDQQSAELIGEEMRLIADAPIHDLVPVSADDRRKRKKRMKEKEDQSFRLFRQDYHLLQQKREFASTNGYQEREDYFELPGKVLHVDGDPNYLKKCLDSYHKLQVPVYGVHIAEKQMPKQVPELVEQVRPNVLVITGHDAYLKSKGDRVDLQSYRHSKHYVRTVKEVRTRCRSLDQLVIFAGACQSHFESLVRAGSNFASSPNRINIHALDPVYIVAKVSYASFMDRVNVSDVIKNSLTGEGGIGGVESKGMLRLGMPRSQGTSFIDE